jgi:hypothetical protein
MLRKINFIIPPTDAIKTKKIINPKLSKTSNKSKLSFFIFIEI